jgi:ribose transport system permease protein
MSDNPGRLLGGAFAKKLKQISSHSEFSVFAGFLLIFVAMSFASHYFLKTSNIFNVLSQISRYGIISVGMALVIITGGIDLSVGYVVGVSSCVAAFLTTKAGLPWPAVLFLTMALGAAVGLANGLLVTKAGLVPFIVTLAMGKVLSGATLLITKGMPISFNSPLAWLGSGYVGVVPVCVIVMFMVMLVGSVFAQATLTGRNIYAVGNNERAAKLSGIHVDRMKCLVYLIASMLSALCGVIVAGNLYSSDASLGIGYEVDIIAAVVIGGVSMMGGEGNIWGALIGAAIMGVLKNAFVLLGVSAYWQTIVIGLVIVGAVALDKARTARKA